MNRFFSFLSRLIPNTVAKSGEVNGIIDGVVLGLDKVQGELNRALKLPVEDAGDEHNFTESAGTRASKIVQFDAAGNPIASNTLGSDLNMASKKITGLPYAAAGSEPVTLDQLNGYAGSLAGLPGYAGQSGKFITTDGTTVYWATIPAIPAQDGSTSGKFLQSNNGSAVWATVPNTVPASTDAGVALTHDGSTFLFRRPSDNLVFNPNGAIAWASGVLGWNGTTPSRGLGVRGYRWFTGTLGAPTTQTWSTDSFAFAGNTLLAASCDVHSLSMTGGSITIAIEFRDASEAVLATHPVVVTQAQSKRVGVAATSPASCANARIKFTFTSVTSTGPIELQNVKAEYGGSATPFNDAATLAWIAGYQATNEFGRGFATAIMRLGDASTTTSKSQWRSVAGAQEYDAQMTVTGGTNGTAGKADVTFESRTLKATGQLGFSQEYNHGNSGASTTVSFLNGSRQRITMTASCAVTLSNMLTVGLYRLKVIQNGTGNFTPTFSGVPITWAGGEAPAAQGPNGVMFVDWYFDGSMAWGSWTQW